MPVLSLVSASIPPEHRDEVSRAYSAAIERGLPVGIRETFLLLGDDGTMAVATVWERPEDLDAMRASGEEPLARRILREAGGAPDAAFFEIVREARSTAA
ncbi:MAG: hypothetical protein E6G08_15380 [Actinobacteria bacterium]|nr:MAG: hypothetical protein E6G08_15380 [Actinomycetota bacterium]